MTIEGIVQAAIIERRVLRFSYDGDASPVRVGHPHALYLGVSSPPQTHVDVFQVSGFTSGDALPGWRSFRVERIISAEGGEERFTPASGWDPMAEKYAGGIVAMV